jgi:hypothetical protein
MLLSVSEILKHTFRLYVKNWRSILPYSALVFVPAAVLALLGVGSVYLSTILPTSDLVNDIVIFLLSIASWFIGYWAMLGLALATKDMLEGLPIPTWRQGLSATGNMVLPILWVSFLTSLIVGLWTLLLIIPGIIFSMYYVFSGYSVLFDGKRGLEALRFSKSMVKGRWWSVAWRVGVTGLFFGILVSIAVFILTAPFTLIASLYSGDTTAIQQAGRTLSTVEVLATMMAGIMSSLGSALAGPLASIALVIIYHDVRKNPLPEPLTGNLTPPTNV